MGSSCIELTDKMPDEEPFLVLDDISERWGASVLKLFAKLGTMPNLDHASYVVDHRLPPYVISYEHIRPHLPPI